MAHRSHSKISKLEPELKETVEEMIKSGVYYKDIAEYIRSHGISISIAAVGKYAKNLMSTLDALRMTQENFRILREEMDRCPDLDITDGILQLLSAEQKENNPRAKFTRSKTLGWYYETEQLKKRIEQFKGGMAYIPRTKIRQTVSAQVQENKFIRDSIDRGNMKVASVAKNIIAQYGIDPENIGAAALAAYAQKGKLVNELNTLQTQIEDLTAQLKVLKKYRKVKGIAEELKNLSGRQEKKFRKEHISELQEYGECRKQILEWYPSGTIPKVEQLEQKINALKQERSQKNDEYRAVKQKSDDLAKAKQEIEVYLKNEREVSQQKRKKRNDLE